MARFALARASLLAAALVGAVVSTTTLGSAQAAAPAPGPSSSASTAPGYDPAMVGALAASLGVSERAAERRLDREAAQQSRLDRLRTAGVRTDGAFFDKDGSLVVNAADARSARRIADAGLTTREAERGEAALDRIKAALDRAAADRAPGGVTSWETDLASDTVTVRVNDRRAPAARAFLKRAGSFGDAVRVVTDAAPAEAQQTVYPGSRMTFGNGPGYCSVGFGARDSAGRPHLVTAGHCVDSLPVLLHNGSRFAQATHSRFRLGANSVDMGVARLDAGSSIATAVGTWGSAGNIAVRGGNRAAVGASVCKSGATTRWTCGTVQGYNVTVTYKDRNGGPDTVVTGLGRSSVCTEGGDSGGAYISGNQAQGMTSGGPVNQRCTGAVNSPGSSYFQPLDDTLSYYGLRLDTN
ncbi:S1 family peptidase [Streptomyces alkaliterrae]